MAEIVLDAQQSIYGAGSYTTLTASRYQIAQIFTIENTGKLSSIKLEVKIVDYSELLYYFEIQTVGLDGFPTGIILATETKEEAFFPTSIGEITINFITPTPVNQGTKYAIVIRASSEGAGDNINFYGAEDALYADGIPCGKTIGSWFNDESSLGDYYFKVYVDKRRTTSPLPIFFRS